MFKRNLILISLLILVVSCAPVVGVPDAEPEVESVNEEAAPLNTAVPINEPAPIDPTNLPDPTTEPIADETESETTQSSAPVVVDLSKMTPEPGDDSDGGNVVLPAPGVPDPTAKLVQDISADLSSRLGIDIGEVELVAIAETTWRDSSLGCPQPGMNYLQVLTDGYNITLKANEVVYEYHTSGTRSFVYCLTATKGDQPITQPISPDQ
ncbi:MAG: hypothetical protein KC419_03030 [Anaerolineales bacterium]|nr:hypothetical protein [Anaerolineales bacterium]